MANNRSPRVSADTLDALLALLGTALDGAVVEGEDTDGDTTFSATTLLGQRVRGTMNRKNPDDTFFWLAGNA